jgi:hypothetical protein
VKNAKPEKDFRDEARKVIAEPIIGIHRGSVKAESPLV